MANAKKTTYEEMTRKHRDRIAALEEKSHLGKGEQEELDSLAIWVARMDLMWADQHTKGMVKFECVQMDSSHLGESTTISVGDPGFRTYTLEAALAGRLGTLPSNFQYPVEYCVKEE